MVIWRWMFAIALFNAAGCIPERTDEPRAVDAKPMALDPKSTQALSPQRHAGPRFQALSVTAQALKARLDQGETIELVDVRSPEAFRLEHIVGAVSRPKIDLVDGKPPLPKDRLIALYCT
ncbi:molybdopterin biosynthesis-like protein MoeZ [compost metagenome]